MPRETRSAGALAPVAALPVDVATESDPAPNRRAEIEQAGVAVAVEQSAHAVVITGTDGNVEYVNPAFTTLTGYGREDVIGQSTRLLKSGRQAPEFYRDLWQTITSGRTWHGELFNLRKDGSLYREEMRISPVRDAAGAIVSYIAIKHDVTERRALEEAHVPGRDRGQFRGRHRSLHTCRHHSHLEPRRGSHLWLHSRGRHRSAGIDADATRGAASPGAVQRTDLASGVVSQEDGVGLHKDGRKLHLSLTGSAIRDAGGEVVAISTTVRDITPRVHAEESRALLASIVDSSDDAISSAALDGTILSWNRGAAALLGYDADEILGKHLSLLIPPDHLEQLRRLLPEVLAGEVRRYDTVRLAKDGRRIDVAITSSPIRNLGGTIVGSAMIAQDIGPRLRAEQRLRDSEERFRSAFEHAPSGMCLIALDGRLLQVNAALCRMLGNSEQELLGTNWRDRTHPDDIPLIARMGQDLLANSAALVDLETRYVRRDGSPFCAQSRASLVRDDARQPLHFVLHLVDITERQRAAEALRASEDRFRTMADGCPTMIWVTNPDGSGRFINRAYCVWFNTTNEAVERRQWQPLLHPDDAAHYVAAWQRAVAEAKTFKAETRLQRADGAWRWFATHAEPQFLPSGAFLGHVGMSFDITERKQAEEAIQASEEKFRQLAENIREVFWMMNVSTGQISYVSPAYEQIWGRTCESLYENPKAWSASILAEDQAGALASLERALADEAVDCEYRIRTADGRTRWIRDRAFPVHGPLGNLTRIAGLAEDITEQKRYQETLLEARVSADAANLAKSRFLANMSHEIRTPMNGVLGMVELLVGTPLSDEQRGYARVIETSGRALLALIDGILDLSKIEAHKVTLERVRCDPRAIAEDVVQTLRGPADARGLTLSWSSTPMPARLYGDPNRLRQVLLNLAANAVKFSERGAVSLSLALVSQRSGEATVRFAVRDTGIGISPDQAAALFSPFVQADASTTRKYGGTGLGLAISKQLVELMGGTIGFESRAEGGSKFWFTTVLATEGDLMPSEPLASTRQPLAGVGTGGRVVVPGALPGARREPRILLAEDNPTNQSVALAQLGRLGFTAQVVSNGAEAVAALERGSYDLILMDCEMPIMDGYEATRRIRGSGSRVPIIAVTASVMVGDRDKSLREGMNDFLAKPVDLARLSSLLDKWLPGSPPPAGLEGAEPTAAEPTAAEPTAAEPTAAEPELPIFDEEAFVDRMMDRALAGRIMQSFVGYVPAQLQRMRERLDLQDGPGARLQAHSLQGSAATVSASRLRAIALELERTAAAGDLRLFADLLPRAAEEFELLETLLSHVVWS